MKVCNLKRVMESQQWVEEVEKSEWHKDSMHSVSRLGLPERLDMI